jgi:hypothetical protein
MGPEPSQKWIAARYVCYCESSGVSTPMGPNRVESSQEWMHAGHGCEWSQYADGPASRFEKWIATRYDVCPCESSGVNARPLARVC